jgi:hypothetical protein
LRDWVISTGSISQSLKTRSVNELVTDITNLTPPFYGNRHVAGLAADGVETLAGRGGDGGAVDPPA